MYISVWYESDCDVHIHIKIGFLSFKWKRDTSTWHVCSLKRSLHYQFTNKCFAGMVKTYPSKQSLHSHIQYYLHFTITWKYGPKLSDLCYEWDKHFLQQTECDMTTQKNTIEWRSAFALSAVVPWHDELRWNSLMQVKYINSAILFKTTRMMVHLSNTFVLQSEAWVRSWKKIYVSFPVRISYCAKSR